LPFFISIASLGHESTHDSQPVQVLASTFAGIVKSFPKDRLLVFIKQAEEFTKFLPNTQQKFYYFQRIYQNSPNIPIKPRRDVAAHAGLWFWVLAVRFRR